ncbi:MAG: autotransporter domain-containing protein [Myxococcales bacterium]|nr:autotransporter domain-containing protein [Myxococcales bacterium]
MISTRNLTLAAMLLTLFCGAPDAAAQAPNGFNFSLDLGGSWNFYHSNRKFLSINNTTVGAEDLMQKGGFDLALRFGWSFAVWRGLFIAVEALFDWTLTKPAGPQSALAKQFSIDAKVHNLVSTGGVRIGYAPLPWVAPWVSAGVGYGFVGFSGEKGATSLKRFAGGFGYNLGVGIDFRVVKYFWLGPVLRFKAFSYKQESDGLDGKGKVVSLSLNLMFQM